MSDEILAKPSKIICIFNIDLIQFFFIFDKFHRFEVSNILYSKIHLPIKEIVFGKKTLNQLLGFLNFLLTFDEILEWVEGISINT
ncbi:hypothetical protein RIR_jg34890.t1 [Rhizophagus irregularis DAOM 181602=DAOM 197198]|uniref:Uncharacterized protein n=1 Tax=Rhizophagus irregularis (strain DAOM 181602 / DAOM 197198 / MUCL 43194) TaxID=747089 RepID=U9TYW7_RHIID|nr:hypothetical protein RIR_jg34890.t1 [Rhizophagus irregularis DAOM 181602=DAOM 197198]